MRMVKNGYRIDILIKETNLWYPYTYHKRPITLEMAEALARGLKRQNAPGRIIQIPEEIVKDEWGC